MSKEIIGTNGVPFGRGYKGNGMCIACNFSEPKVIWVGGNPQLMCGYYAATCKSVSRNCSGIKSFKEPSLIHNPPIKQSKEKE